MPGKKKLKKKKSSKSKSKEGHDPVAPEYLDAPVKPGQRLVELLTTHKVEEKELHGFKVTTKVLEQLTPQEIRDLKIVFDTFDGNSDGYLNVVEFRKAFKVLGFRINKKVAKQMVTDVDLRKKGAIEFNEFLEFVIERQMDSRDVKAEIMQGFDMFDYDKQSKISMDNLKQACRETGVKFSIQELEEMMEEADANGDSFIDPAEFERVMLQTNLFY
ncbi:unnamed protein product [Owenia fusiformis]|uniref:Uncharacterized protein n=1 Tax=Owenia fusiformis TaxID=6347 RepID=A0A8J1XQL0_OWEFU|nr:unnamed protein product [Owenia fusiformis]